MPVRRRCRLALQIGSGGAEIDQLLRGGKPLARMWTKTRGIAGI
jgi:hypothetical protein